MVRELFKWLKAKIKARTRVKSLEFNHGKNFNSNSIVDSLVPSLVTIGDDFISGPGSIILAHDASLVNKYGVYRLEPTTIGNRVFVGANATILPGVKIGDDVIVGAGAVVTRDVESGVVVAGVPAVVLGTVEDYRNNSEVRGVLYDVPASMMFDFKNGLMPQGRSREDVKKLASKVTRS